MAEPLTDYYGIYAHNALAPVVSYVDRPDLRRRLEEHLHDRTDRPIRKTQIAVLHGFGGVGKTQLVLDYVQRHRNDYSAIFWIEAGSLNTIERDYVQIYALLYNVHQDTGQSAIQVAFAVPAVKRWFYGRGKRWLFVFDDADTIGNQEDPSYVDLRYFMPDDPCAHIIIMTRDRSAADITELTPIEVDEMKIEEAIALFKRQAKLNSTTSHQDGQILSIIQELGCLALAINLAGSYVAATPRLRIDLAQYLLEYKERGKELLAQKPTWLIHQYGKSILTTWESTFDAVQRKSPEASNLLSLLSLLNKDTIPGEIPVTLISGEAAGWLSIIFPDKKISKYDIEIFLRLLVSFSFIKYSEVQGTYSMHNLIQTWAYERLEGHQQRQYCLAAGSLLQTMITASRQSSPVARGRIIPHVTSVFYKILHCFESCTAEDELVILLVDKMRLYFHEVGQRKETIAATRFVLQKYQSLYECDDNNTIGLMSDLAAAFDRAGQLQEATSMHRMASEMSQQLLGEDHPDTLRCLHGLACSLMQTEQVYEAVLVQRNVVQKRQQLLGEDHNDTLLSMHTLACALDHAGQAREALTIQQRVVEKHRRLVGDDDLETLTYLHNMARMLLDVGQSKQALSISREVVKKRKELQGENHPDILGAIHLLSLCLIATGETQDALLAQRQVLESHQQILGEDHPETLLAALNFALVLSRAGQKQQALQIQREVLSKRQQLLGKSHPATLVSLHAVATDLFHMGETQEALSIQRDVVQKRTEVLGHDHPDTERAIKELSRMEELEETE